MLTPPGSSYVIIVKSAGESVAALISAVAVQRHVAVLLHDVAGKDALGGRREGEGVPALGEHASH